MQIDEIRNIKMARYSNATNHQLMQLAERGVGCLDICPGGNSKVQRNSLQDARMRFRNRVIDKDNYRHRIRMVLNHCRYHLTETNKFIPASRVKPQITAFLRKCRDFEDVS